MNYCRNCDLSKPVGEWQIDCTEGMFGSKYMWAQSACPSIFGCTKYQQFKIDSYYKEYKDPMNIVVKKEVSNAKSK